MADKSKLILVGGAKPQKRKASGRGYSKPRASAFLTVLAETCNVSEACRRSGLPMTVAYRRRKNDAAFRAGWLDAIATAYRRLELVLLERAFNGTEKLIKRRDGSEERMREYSDALGLNLLKLHQASAAEAEVELPQADADEVRERLIAKLKRLRQRFEAEDAAQDAREE